MFGGYGHVSILQFDFGGARHRLAVQEKMEEWMTFFPAPRGLRSSLKTSISKGRPWCSPRLII
jgi:hypothetical protein